MKIKDKNKFVITVAIVLIIVSITVTVILNFRKNNTETLPDYEYTELDDGTLELTKYRGIDVEVDVTSDVDGKTVTRIGNSCFIYRGLEVENVNIPDTVTSIGNGAFEVRKNLTITGGENVEVIEPYAFSSCRFKLDFPYMENLKVIGESAFSSSSGLDTIKLSDSLEYIGEWAFSFSDISYIDIPQNVEFIGYKAFCDTPYAEGYDDYLVVGDGIMIFYPITKCVIVPYGTKMVSNCNGRQEEIKVSEFYIPDTVTKIEKNIIYKSEGVTIYIPSSVEQIGGFDDEEDNDNLLYSDMDKATLVVEAGSYAESYAIEKGLNYEIVDSVQALYDETVATRRNVILLDGDYEYSIGSDDNVTIRRYLGKSTDVTFPDNINGMTVTGIGKKAKSVCRYDTVANITIPDTVTSIGSQAFWETEWFNSLKGNTVVGDGILIRRETYEDYNNKDIWIPQGVKKMMCDNTNDVLVENIYIPDSVETIEKDYFKDITHANIYIPSSVTDLGEYGDSDEVAGGFGKGICIKAEEGSYALQFAIDNGLDYEIVDDIQAVYEDTMSQN